MALFSRRKKSDPQPDVEPEAPVDTAADQAEPEAPAAPVPSVGISVQAFRGVGAEAGNPVASARQILEHVRLRRAERHDAKTKGGRSS
jgi:hypothetical protein